MGVKFAFLALLAEDSSIRGLCSLGSALVAQEGFNALDTLCTGGTQPLRPRWSGRNAARIRVREGSGRLLRHYIESNQHIYLK